MLLIGVLPSTTSLKSDADIPRAKRKLSTVPAEMTRTYSPNCSGDKLLVMIGVTKIGIDPCTPEPSKYQKLFFKYFISSLAKYEFNMISD
jgi:hypothetical protein